MKQIFVYGTLRTGMYNYDKYLKPHHTFQSYGYVKGSLHTLKEKKYPALIPGPQMILGEIHQIPDELQPEIDLLESYYGENNPKNEYNKIQCSIYNSQGTQIARLPVYFYNLNNPENKAALGAPIACNDYVTYMLTERS